LMIRHRGNSGRPSVVYRKTKHNASRGAVTAITARSKKDGRKPSLPPTLSKEHYVGGEDVNRDGILMVREISDGGRWTLPGGWADVNRTAAQSAVKEALEESGFEVEPLKLAAVWDRTKQGHAPHVFSCCKLFFVCALIGGRAATSHETSEIGWFHETNIPADLSLERVLPQQIRRMFAHRRDPALSTDFD